MEVQRLKAEQEKLAKMSSEERLIYEIQLLDVNSAKDIERSKTDLYDQVIETKQKEATLGLKVYW